MKTVGQFFEVFKITGTSSSFFFASETFEEPPDLVFVLKNSNNRPTLVMNAVGNRNSSQPMRNCIQNTQYFNLGWGAVEVLDFCCSHQVLTLFLTKTQVKEGEEGGWWVTYQISK
jgi:hypothetical protein